MDLQTVKQCFEKYARYLESNEKVKLPEDFNPTLMTVQEIDSMTQQLFMDYVLKCDDKVNQFSVPCTLYKHINSLIRQYIQEGSIKPEEPVKVEPKPARAKGWFF